jgi:hypothetical protein
MVKATGIGGYGRPAGARNARCGVVLGLAGLPPRPPSAVTAAMTLGASSMGTISSCAIPPIHMYRASSGAMAPRSRASSRCRRCRLADFFPKGGSPLPLPLMWWNFIPKTLRRCSRPCTTAAAAAMLGLDEDVVHPASAPVHGNLDSGGGESEPAALVGIEDFRLVFANAV